MSHQKDSSFNYTSENIADNTAIRRFIGVFFLITFAILLSNYLFVETKANPIIVSTVIDASATVDGIAEPFSRVTISLNNGAGIQTQADEKGRFIVELPVSNPGEYLVTAQSGDSSLLGKRHSQVRLNYDPNLKTLITRRVTVFLSYRHISVDLLASLPRDNQDALDYLSGKITFQDFIKNVFGDVYSFGGHDLSEWFEEIKPEISYTPTSLIFRASSTPKSETVRVFDSIFQKKVSSDYTDSGANENASETEAPNSEEENLTPDKEQGQAAQKKGQENIKFWLGWEDDGSAAQKNVASEAEKKTILNDNFVLWVENYDLDSISVSPTTQSRQNIVSWSSDNETLKYLNPSSGGIVGRFSFEPLQSPSNLLTASKLTPQDIFPFEVDSLIAVVVWVLISLPMLWLIRILRRPVFQKRFRAGIIRFGATLLILLSFITRILYLIKDETTIIILALTGMGILCACLSLKLPKSNQAKSWKYFVAQTLIYPFGFFVAAIILAFYSYVIPQAIYDYGRLLSPSLIPALLLLAVFPILKQLKRSEKFTKKIGLLIFSCYVIGTTSNVFLIPVPFIISLILYSRVLMISPQEYHLLQTIKKDVFNNRVHFYQNQQDIVPTLQKRVEQVKEQFILGNTPIDEFRQENEELKGLIVQEEANLKIAGIKKEYLVFRFGYYADDWKNGLWGVKHSLIISLPLIVFFAWGLSQRSEIFPSFSETFIFLVSRIGSLIVGWAIAGFFFGYFFTRIKGETGLKKAISVSLVHTCCFLPIWLVAPISPIIVLLLVLQVFIFYLIIGFWGFDYSILRTISGKEFNFIKIAQIEGIPTFTTFASAALTTIGVAINSAITGQITTIINQIFTTISFFSQLPHK